MIDLSVIEPYDSEERIAAMRRNNPDYKPQDLTIERSCVKKREPPVTVAVNHSFKVAAKAAQRVSDTKRAIEEYKRDGNANYRSKQLNANDIRADERHARFEHERFDVSRPIIARWMKAQRGE